MLPVVPSSSSRSSSADASAVGEWHLPASVERAAVGPLQSAAARASVEVAVGRVSFPERIDGRDEEVAERREQMLPVAFSSSSSSLVECRLRQKVKRVAIEPLQREGARARVEFVIRPLYPADRRREEVDERGADAPSAVPSLRPNSSSGGASWAGDRDLQGSVRRERVESIERVAARGPIEVAAEPISASNRKREREEKGDDRRAKRHETLVNRPVPESPHRASKRKGEEAPQERSVRSRVVVRQKENSARPPIEEEKPLKKACLDRPEEEPNLERTLAGLCALFSRHETLFAAGLGLDPTLSPLEQATYLVDWLEDNQPFVEELDLDQITGEDLVGFRDLLYYEEERQLRELPDFFDCFPELHKLSAARNELTDLPSTLSETVVDTLLLSENLFSHVPQVIGKMAQLRELDLSRQRALLDLSDDSPLWDATSLVRLDLSNNRILHLSQKIAQLASLRSLNLEGVRLNTLPNALLVLEELDEINVRRTGLHPLEIEGFLLEALKQGKAPILLVDIPSDEEREIPFSLREEALYLGYSMEYCLGAGLGAELRAVRSSD